MLQLENEVGQLKEELNKADSKNLELIEMINNYIK